MQQNIATTLFIIVLTFIILNFGFSQVDYSKFEYPDVERKALDFSFRMNNFYNNYGTSNTQNRNNSLSMNGFLDYSLLLNNRKKQQITTLFGNISLDYNNERVGFPGGQNNIYNRFYPILRYSDYNRYYKDDKKFKELYYQVSGLFFRIKNNNITNNTLAIHPAIGYRIGRGRIEPASELFDAMFIVSDLNNRGFQIEMEESTLFEFGRLMAIQRQRRILDSRRLYVLQQESINEWLASHIQNFQPLDFVSTSVVVSDNWLFNQFFNRAIGKRNSIGMELRTSYESDLNNFEQDRSQLSFYAETYNTKPVNQFLHRSTLIMAGLAYNREGVYTNRLLNESAVSPFVNAAYRIAYYPVSRTSLSLTADTRVVYNFGFNDSKNNWLFIPRLTFNMSYFLNYQTRINADFRLLYSYSSEDFIRSATVPDHEIFGNQNSIISQENVPRSLLLSNAKGVSLIGGISVLHSFY